jgi:hypothetical protein
MPPIWIPSYDACIDNLSALPNRSAEKRVAEALNMITSPDVWILHSLRYSKQREIGAAVNLEIDFLVVWKRKGFLILEVKGGRIDFDPVESKWWVNPKGQPRRQYRRSPVAQVEGQKNDLCSEILPGLLSKGLNPRNLVERVLVFPDVSRTDFKDARGQKPERVDDFELDFIADREQMETLALFVEQKLEPCANYVQQERISGKVFEDVVNFLRSPVRAEIPPQHILEHAESGIKAATDEQKEHLSHVMGAHSLVMEGPAGTAKTVLGLSAVLTWAENGAAAYYITANKYLVEGLRKDSRYSVARDRILSIREFLEMALGQSHLEDNDDALVGALSEWEFTSKGYCIVIDEVQDLNEDLYESLVSLLPCEKLWVLRDNRQSLERRNDLRRYDLGFLSGSTPYSLTKNCRNTRKIAEHIKKNVRLPEGYVNNLLDLGDRDPDEILVESQEKQDQKLLQVIKESEKEGHPRESIVVLSCLPEGGGAVRTKYCSPRGPATFNAMFSYGGEDRSKVAIFHALDFRGLESPFVIVTDIHDQEAIFRANYLSGSRAKFRLVLIRVEDQQIRTARESGIPKGLSFD